MLVDQGVDHRPAGAELGFGRSIYTRTPDELGHGDPSSEMLHVALALAFASHGVTIPFHEGLTAGLGDTR